MDKKGILSNASAALKTSGKANFIDRAGRRIKLGAVGFYAWLRRLDKLAWFNIMLLFLVCAMLAVMIGQVKIKRASDNRAIAAAETLRRRGMNSYDLAERLARRDRPTLVVSRNDLPMIAAAPSRARRSETQLPDREFLVPASKQVVSLPIRRALQFGLPAMGKIITGDLMVDGHGRVVRLPPMTTVDGSLIIQNMRNFTLPCGTRINGDLLLRNVGLLKFCGCFKVAGNIYVSRNSSFGPIPKDAFLGGQVIF